MKGILLISLGESAKGLAQTAMLFFGEDIEQLEYICLDAGDDAVEFKAKIKQQIRRLDMGDGVVILADFLGGTLVSQSAACLSDNVDLISGVNLPMLLQLLSDRQAGKAELEHILRSGREGILDVKAQFASLEEGDWLTD